MILVIGMAVAAAIIGLACAALAWAHPRRTSSLCSVDPPSPRIRGAAARANIRETAPEGCWELALIHELDAAPSDAAKVAAINEQLGDLDHQLKSRTEWPRTAIRIVLLGSCAVSVVGFALGARLELGVVATIGLLSAGVCGLASMRGESAATRQRDKIDKLIKAMSSDLEH